MLQIKNLHAGYNELEILKGIDIQVKKNEIVSIIGPNGAGKSTIIKSIFNLTNITGGYIFFNDENIIGLKTHQLIKKGICFLNQGRIIFGNLTIKENLQVSLNMIKDKKEIENRVNSIYDKFPILNERKNDFAFSLSGGQQQMLALGRALITKPKILLLDEPSLGLSPILQKEVFEILKKLKKEISILIVEQNAKKAIEISDRVYLLEDGKIVLNGTGKSILKDNKIKDVYLGGRY